MTKRYHSETVIEARHRMAHVMPEIIFPFILIGAFLLIALTLRAIEKKRH